MLLSRCSEKVQLVVGLGASFFVCGWFLNMALMLFEKPYVSGELQLVGLTARLILAAIMGVVAVRTAKKVLALIP
ncbi:MAG: hypothetical protein ACJ8F3_20950 [Xanthobacteraceae bacterium]